MARRLVWFRQDLRTHDHAALSAACQHPDDEVMALYVMNEGAWLAHDTAPIKVDFDLRTLIQLRQRLIQLGIPLLLRQVAADADIPALFIQLASDIGMQEVLLHVEHGPNELQRDRAVNQALTALNINMRFYEDACIVPPGNLHRPQGDPYQVFTPFKRRWLQVVPTLPTPLAAPQPRRQSLRLSDPIPHPLPGWIPEVSSWPWPAGEDEALQRLELFCNERIHDYATLRDIPSQPGTSQLSPYLANGSLSPRMALHQALATPPGSGRDTWLGELAWRDFFKHILVDYPRVGRHRAFDLSTEGLIWSKRNDHFEAWCQGRTGFPLIDAAMRQLLQTGWMHNRLRMVTAMFLVKDLWLDWRWGERWFMQHLIDGDLAANNGGWQWSASTGVDAVPYFRIFNPWTQSQRFDPDGLFIRTWLPELAPIPPKRLHCPPGSHPLTDSYPWPIIRHDQARLHALAAFKNLRTLS